MRTANLHTAIQSLSKIQNAAILLVTADPMCGNTAFQDLDFLSDEAVDELRFSGSVVVKAENEAEWLALRGMAIKFSRAFDAQARLGAEAVLFQAGTPVFQIACEGVQTSRLAA